MQQANHEMVLLDVQDLKTYYFTVRGSVKAVDGINFQVNKGEALGLAGESGCGKTTVALSLMKILPHGGKIVGGKVFFNGENLVELEDRQMRKRMRWKKISLVFQGAMNALHPCYRIGDQIVEAIMIHETHVEKKEAREKAGKLLEMVGIESSRASSYPHELSGGMKQRAMMSMALACDPELLIADEPGTALDVIIQAQVLKLLKELKKTLDLGMILISHDLSIIAETCEKCAIMYAGKIMEYGDIVNLFKKPLHPYTKGLTRAFPSIKGAKRRMVSIPGFPPNLMNPPLGCRFQSRCSLAAEICRKEEPAFLEVRSKHYVACHRLDAQMERTQQ